MRKDRFTDEALRNAQALAELKNSENEEDQLRFSETYDFARCQRPDGSVYGIADGKQCKKGRPKAAIEADMRRLTSSGAMQAKGIAGVKARAEHARLKTELAAAIKSSPKKPKTDFRKEVAEGAARRRKGEANIANKQKEEMRLKKAIARMYSRETNARRDGDTAAAKKFMKAHGELVKRLEEVQSAKGYDAAPKRSARSKSSKKSESGTPEQRMQLRRLEERMDNAVTMKDQQRISTAIRELRKRMGEG